MELSEDCIGRNKDGKDWVTVLPAIGSCCHTYVGLGLHVSESGVCVCVCVSAFARRF